MTDPAGTRAFVENASSKDKMLDIIDEAEGHWHLLLTEPGAETRVIGKIIEWMDERCNGS